ncbi:MAG: hypothetical protein WDM80_06070 [Limisphaerales bacterium]
MNAERLHAIAVVLHAEMTSNDTVGKLEELRSSLETVLGQNHSRYQENLATSLTAFYASLNASPIDNLSPAWRQILKEIGGDVFFGSRLKKTVEEILQRNQITPSVALKEIGQLREKLEEFQKALDGIIASFKEFHIGNEKLQPGECEIGLLIPRKAVHNQMLEFAAELKELTFILDTLSEVSTSKPSDHTIKTISSSDLTVYLAASIPFAVCLAKCIERIVALYKQLLDIKRSRSELIKSGVPDTQMTGIESHANNLMDQGIENLSVEIVATAHPKLDDGRKNELVIKTRISLNKLANRIDRGYNIEVRVQPLENVAEDEKSKKVAKEIQTIQTASKNMQFLKLEGEPILRLPEKISENSEKPKIKKGRVVRRIVTDQK